MSELKIGKGLTLPADAATETFAVLGRRGSGKTYTASVLAEELLEAGQQVVILDPLDVWFGLRSSPDGRSTGYPITIFGGDHADVPLEPRAGALLADVIVEQRIAAILSLRHLSKTELRTFVADFGERLYERKAKPEFRTPLHLMIDEADAVVPQRLFPGAERAFGAIDTLVRRGRSSGVGTTLISQRAAVIAKDVLTQTEVLICHQTTGPQDRKALEAWIEAHDTGNRKKAFLESIAGLKRGTAWVWSPAWLDLFQRVEIRARVTFDSSSTPKAGARPMAPKVLAPVDLERLKSRIADTLERAQADDPKALKKRIAELEKQLREVPAPKVVERTVFDEKAVDAIEHALDIRIQSALELLDEAKRELGAAFKDYRMRCRSAVALGERGVSRAALPERSSTKGQFDRKADSPIRASRPTNGAGEKMPAGERRILTVLAQCGPSPKRKVAAIAGYAVNGGGFNNYLSALRTKGWLIGSGDLAITDAGEKALGHYEPLPTGRALLEHWCGQVSKAERLILMSLAQVHPGTWTKDLLAEDTGYAPDGGGFNNAISHLRTLELIEGRGELRIKPELVS